MRGRQTIQWLMAASVLLAVGAPALRAQDCDDSDPCTVNDACGVDGTCQGTFQMGKSCDDFQDCTTNDTCRNDPLTGMPGCSGDSAPANTPCAGGCGTCQQLVPVPGVPLLCSGNAADNGKSCDPGLGLGACFVGTCRITSPSAASVSPPAFRPSKAAPIPMGTSARTTAISRPARVRRTRRSATRSAIRVIRPTGCARRRTSASRATTSTPAPRRARVR